METFIVIIALLASASGTLLLLACLANKRSQLVTAYNVKLEAESRQQSIEDCINDNEDDSTEDIPEVS